MNYGRRLARPRGGERGNFTLPRPVAGGIGLRMRFPLLILAIAVCPMHADARPFHWPWSAAGQQRNQESRQLAEQAQEQAAEARVEKKKMRLFPLFSTSRSREQQRLNAATTPQPSTREEQVLKPDFTREFNPNAANFGTSHSLTGKPAAAGAFHFEDRTRTKSFETGAFTTKKASAADSKFATKSMPTKTSWFSRLTAPTKTYATRESRDAGRGLQGATLPGSEKKYVAIGRRQAELDKHGASMMPMGDERDLGQSYSGDVRPMSIQDVKSLLNKN